MAITDAAEAALEPGVGRGGEFINTDPQTWVATHQHRDDSVGEGRRDSGLGSRPRTKGSEVAPGSSRVTIAELRSTLRRHPPSLAPR